MTQLQALDDVIAEQVRQYRLMKGWSVRQLADACAALGAPQLTTASLGNIERGQDPDAKRPPRRVGAAELAVLATALDVPPLALMVPANGSRLQITSELAMTPMEAVDWFTATRPPARLPTVGFQRAAAPLRLYATVSELREQVQNLERAADRARRAGDEDQRMELRTALDERLMELARALNSMAEIGVQVPSLDQRWIDRMTANGWLHHPDRVPNTDQAEEGAHDG